MVVTSQFGLRASVRTRGCKQPGPPRGITEVAIIGYSHGGGSIYDLAWYLTQPAATAAITKPYTVPLTSYVDAINEHSGFAERRRPALTMFHMSQYQRNDAALNGNSTIYEGGANDNINRSGLTDGAGAVVNHSSIDDHDDVLDLIRARIEQKVSR